MTEDVKVLDLAIVDESQLPSIVSTQFDNLAELEKHIQDAMTLAGEAKEKAGNAQVSVGWFNKKDAIERLQDAAQGLAKAQISVVDAQKLLFEYQTKLTKITKFLLGLGISNLVSNRTVVRELELKLKGASEEEISELAKQELRNVILQLKAQEDMMEKQEFLKGKVKEHAGQIQNLGKQLEDKEEIDDEQDVKIAENTKDLAKHDEILFVQQQKDIEHDRLFEEQVEKDKEHDRLLAEGIERDKKQDLWLEEQAKKDMAHDHLFAEQNKRNERYDHLLEEQAEKIREQDRVILEQAEILSEYRKLFDELVSKNEKYDDMFLENAQKNEEQDKFIESLNEKKEILENQVGNNLDSIKKIDPQIADLKENKADKKMTYISLAIAIVSLAITCIQFLL